MDILHDLGFPGRCRRPANPASDLNPEAPHRPLIRPDDQFPVDHSVKPGPEKAPHPTVQDRDHRGHFCNDIAFTLAQRDNFLQTPLIILFFLR